MAVEEVGNNLFYCDMENEFSEIKHLENCIGNGLSAVTKKIGSIFRHTNRFLYYTSTRAPELHGMATTMTAALINNNRLSLAHVGHGRAYLIRADMIEQLTDDHTMAAGMIKGGIMSCDQARYSPMNKVITRALGYTPKVEVDLDELVLINGDVIVLCSDGLSAMIEDRDILNIVTSTTNPVLACNELVTWANKRGGRDNITVIVVYFGITTVTSLLYNIFH